MKSYENYKDIEKVLANTKYNLDDYKKLLNKFTDETSKMNLFYRVMFDNTNDAYYALMLEKMMYYNSPFFSKEDKEFFDYIQFLLNNKNYNKKIYIVGLPFYEEGYVWNLFTYIIHKHGGLNVQNIYDDICNKKNIKFDCFDIPVCPLENIFDLELDNDSIIIISNNYYSYVKDSLIEKNKGIENNIFVFNGISRYYRYIQYFCEPFIKLDKEEIFIDGGASDLDTTIKFIDYVDGYYNKVYAFEPLLDDYNRALENLKYYGFKNVEILNYGLWDSNITIGFNYENNGSSAIALDGKNTINTCSIDNVLEGKKATIIKMDIEGAEYNAIIGAKKTIKKYNPILMVCVYHKPNDVFELSDLVLSLNPDYELFLRHYAFSICETVMYFVPKNKINEF